jgi:hypothetical protein
MVLLLIKLEWKLIKEKEDNKQRNRLKRIPKERIIGIYLMKEHFMNLYFFKKNFLKEKMVKIFTITFQEKSILTKMKRKNFFIGI